MVGAFVTITLLSENDKFMFALIDILYNNLITVLL
jgi:hypothetical protein